MHQYTIYRHPSGQTEVVKVGWSWPAFFFLAIWALVKKMWALGFGLIVGFVAVSIIFTMAGAEGVGSAVTNVMSLAGGALLGRYGNTLRELNLTSRGFDKMETVTAANAECATALHLKAAPAAI